MSLEFWIALVALIAALIAIVVVIRLPSLLQAGYNARLDIIQKELTRERHARETLESRLQHVVTENLRLNGVILWLYNVLQLSNVDIPKLPDYLKEARPLGDISVQVGDSRYSSVRVGDNSEVGQASAGESNKQGKYE